MSELKISERFLLGDIVMHRTGVVQYELRNGKIWRHGLKQRHYVWEECPWWNTPEGQERFLNLIDAGNYEIASKHPDNFPAGESLGAYRASFKEAQAKA